MENKNLLKSVKVAIIALIITMLITTTGFAFIYKKTRQDLQNKDYKISTLVDEIGELKDKNEKIIQMMSTENKNFDQLGLSIKTLNDQKNNQLAQLQSNLKNVANERENLVSELVKVKKETTDISKNTLQNFAVNILILGEHDKLTDTIIVLSIHPESQQNILLSIPRDIFYNGRKINELYQKYGIEELKKVVGKISGLNIERFVIFDMQSFVTIVDTLGGIDVNVEKNLVDRSYPGPNNTYKIVSFKKGLQHFDGKKALQYARSRESTSDFDRSLRQQQIMKTIKEKIETLNLSNNVVAVAKIYEKVKDQIATDINLVEALEYLRNYRNFEIKTGNALTTQNYLYSSVNSAGQYILLPRKKDFSEMKKYINDLAQT